MGDYWVGVISFLSLRGSLKKSGQDSRRSLSCYSHKKDLRFGRNFSLSGRVSCVPACLFRLIEILLFFFWQWKKERLYPSLSGSSSKRRRIPPKVESLPSERWLLRKALLCCSCFLLFFDFSFNTTTTVVRSYTDKWNWGARVILADSKYPKSIILRCCFNSLRSLKSLGFLDGVCMRV